MACSKPSFCRQVRTTDIIWSAPSDTAVVLLLLHHAEVRWQ